MVTNDKGIVELKHFILREVCRLAWEGRLTAEETEKIGYNAFADCPNLICIYIPEATTDIDPYAFGSMNELAVFGKYGSYAETYAQAQGFDFIAVCES